MSLLPEQFNDLEPYSGWCLATELERRSTRYASTMDDIQAFYAATKPRMPEITNYLNQFSLDTMPEDARQLLLLGLSFVEASMAVEVFGRQQVVKGFDGLQMQLVE
jgi:hypothetical protein